MPVVSKVSNLVTDRINNIPNADPELVRGRPVVATGTVANAVDDSAGSTYHLVDIPAHAILDSRTAFAVTNWGFATVQIGTLEDPDALISVAKSAGATVAPIAFGDAKHGLPAWQVLGYAAEPSDGIVSLYAYGPANAAGAGSMLFEIHYRAR
ncbi:hypothetical protein D2T31_00610 [Sinirhodobacter populi]|uniref:Uncharacterized protein n=1 Tax=Paenirhodobacter populi TaxID=2306993 RepID=A0A443KID8_9RHOB|nr:hypothetical protein [Sinirhodobacter populi]RWR32519.1 hypothetical protein D2T31_00610 [Sinirhodobacter populi]